MAFPLSLEQQIALTLQWKHKQIENVYVNRIVVRSRPTVNIQAQAVHITPYQHNIRNRTGQLAW